MLRALLVISLFFIPFYALADTITTDKNEYTAGEDITYNDDCTAAYCSPTNYDTVFDTDSGEVICVAATNSGSGNRNLVNECVDFQEFDNEREGNYSILGIYEGATTCWSNPTKTYTQCLVDSYAEKEFSIVSGEPEIPDAPNYSTSTIYEAVGLFDFAVDILAFGIMILLLVIK